MCGHVRVCACACAHYWKLFSLLSLFSHFVLNSNIFSPRTAFSDPMFQFIDEAISVGDCVLVSPDISVLCCTAIFYILFCSLPFYSPYLSSSISSNSNYLTGSLSSWRTQSGDHWVRLSDALRRSASDNTQEKRV